MKTDVYKMVTDQIIKALENGVVTWHQPWNSPYGESPYVSHTNGKPYSFLNMLLLMSQGGEVGEYITHQQAHAEGGRIKKGAKAKFVVFSKRCVKTKKVTDAEGNEVEETSDYYVLRYYNVFHINDCEDIKAKYAQEKPAVKQIDPIGVAEEIVQGYEARETTLKIYRNNETDRAYYSPSRDEIHVPCIGQYNERTEYYSTLFHEMVHSTGIEKRCNRGIERSVAKGKEYSTEELVAEIGSAMMMHRLGIQIKSTFDNSTAYIQSWLKSLRNDKRMIVIASAQAEKAVKYIHNEK